MIRKYAEIFCWKNVSSFCSAKATHIFPAKHIIILCIESAKTVNEMTLNELVKLTVLWTTGPRTFWLKKTLDGAMALVICIYHIYPKYSDTSTPYHSCPKIWTRTIYRPMLCLKYYWMSGKQCGPWWDTTFCGISSGSTLFAQACLSQYIW